MKIPDTILDEIIPEIWTRLCEAAEAHVETGRKASVTLKLTISRDKETLKRQLYSRVSAMVPEGADDSHTRKGAPELLMSVADEIPGQQKIGEEP